ncbi:MAG: hypothetical protein DRN07_07530 [Thermoplasmata archaeon]|nr:MAG: hypothetical protein DRN07_07530 [Thermoplasmata archaeon]
MDRIMAVCVVTLFLMSTGSILTFSKEETLTEIFVFPEPEIKEKNGYVQVLMENASYVRRPGMPVIPFYKKVYVLPFASRVSVSCDVRGVREIETTGNAATAHPFFSYGGTHEWSHDNGKEPVWYSHRMAAGIKDGRHVNYLIVNFYPVQYGEGNVLFASNYTLKIRYTTGGYTEHDAYDMVIICPWTYTFAMNRLAAHRESQGVSTKVVSLFDIYSGRYFEGNGRDNAEKIKYFIKNAVEEWGIQHVLLVGDTMRVPSRTVYAYDGSEPSFLSDLYYADVFDAEGAFSSWDTNSNGYFGEYNHSGNKDVMDIYPDVYVARLPCRNMIEAFFVVSKIMRYDATEKGEWFNRFVVVAGDSFNDSSWGTDYIEGEITTAKSVEYMAGFEAVKLWASLGTLTKERILSEFTEGAGFIHFDGHGSYLSWATHPVHDYHTWVGISVQDMPAIKNTGRPAVVMIGGCHTGQIGMLYECFGYRLIRKSGGAIATVGYTSLSWGADDDVNGNGDPDIIEYASGYLNTLFFKQYGVNHAHTLGQMWGDAITEYLHNSPVEWNDAFLDVWDAKTVESWILMGDPSLLIE